ncbi:23S rRNA (adenine(2503)-C(2))-methyltransferase RlmN [Aliifodinibius sp. S!AR15-10]|uniref:23S rRNA (adenine(2503)-C(2))-methyltransferase RlmN n=1 Tax=Aliifodinibius sp. S!AR15-10 TaxID=2950437 RepID=UPI0028650948|nr:23S rRNA (adenine(2503)-C(2))-methyltransferase RlmN [Aliifodinibius sp. S!AR15-10]MDR8393286.1 23S rRNA (adenine(2503)-C(2))-methyltransferase RlmN [Aliifodinibius sp. S!AR15-10]
MDTTEKTTQKTDLKSLTKQELQAFSEELGLQSYRSDQIFQWLYQKGVSTFEEMTNLSKDLRTELEEIAAVNRIQYVRHQESQDGTMKFLFKLEGEEDHKIESVLIPDFYPDGVPNRLTVCVSSQVGCVFGCSFCATGKMGFFTNLTHGEIVDQVQYINEVCEQRYGKGVTNIVYMGMGEPLHNYQAVVQSADILTDELGLGLSPKRITVSTVGLTKQIKKLADQRQPFNLAISLHAANDEKRDEIMPINNSMNLEQLEEAVKYYYNKLHRPITYEYLLFDEFNDSVEDARQLAEIVHWAPSKVNIIMYNDVSGVKLKRAREQRLDKFMQELISHDVTATVRRSRGDDIDAGCGQLVIKEGQKGKTISKN